MIVLLSASETLDMNVLIIEDDPMVATGITRILNDEGMETHWECDGLSGQHALESNAYSVVILDIGLPRKSGFDVLKSIRHNGNDVPLLVLSARDEEDDRVLGLTTGADDYIVKPVGAKELIARIHAVLRRQWREDDCTVSNGEMTLDLTTSTLAYRDMQQVLTPREQRLMSALLASPGTIMSRSQIEARVYEGDAVESNALEVLIHGLRRKFDKQVIRNVRGIGWMVLKNLV